MALERFSPEREVTEEYLTVEEEDRPTLLPLRYEDIWAWSKLFESLIWTFGETDLSRDRPDWEHALSAGDRAYYRMAIGMAGVADEMVTKNLRKRFLDDFAVKEVVSVFTVQALHELVHSESYSRTIEAIFVEEEQAELFNAIKTMPVVGKIMAWVDRWICSKDPIGVRLAAFATFEGGMFQGLFLSIQLLKERGVMPGITMLNELIQRDEGNHCLFGCFLLTKHIVNRPSKEQVYQIMGEGIALMDEFFTTACNDAKIAEGLPITATCPVRNISEARMHTYVRSVFDAVCSDMGYTMMYKVLNPYPETAKLTLNEVLKTNFFEHLVTQYNLNVDYQFSPQLDRCQVIGFGGREVPRERMIQTSRSS